MNWTAFDYLVAAVMVGSAAMLYVLAARLTGNRAYRAGTAVAVGTAVVLIWVNGAVGIIGSEDDPANLMFAGVLAVGILGALLARFRARGMARAMVAAAVAQSIVACVSLVGALGAQGAIASVFFAGLWLLSAWLFRKASREGAPAEAAG